MLYTRGDIMTIRELREKTGLSQSKFAELLHIPVRTIQVWEINQRKPPIYVNELIEKVLRYEGHIKE